MYIQADRYFRLLWALFASFGKIGIFMNNGAPSKFTVYDPLKSDKKSEKSYESTEKKSMIVMKP